MPQLKEQLAFDEQQEILDEHDTQPDVLGEQVDLSSLAADAAKRQRELDQLYAMHPDLDPENPEYVLKQNEKIEADTESSTPERYLRGVRRRVAFLALAATSAVTAGAYLYTKDEVQTTQISDPKVDTLPDPALDEYYVDRRIFEIFQQEALECGAGMCEHTLDSREETCDPYAGAVMEVCNDGLDNDCDGLTDCRDPNCAEDCSVQIEETRQKVELLLDLNEDLLLYVNPPSDTKK